MAKKFYLDTSIWRDYFEDRHDSIRPLGEFAFRFLRNCEKAGCTVFYSEAVVHELKRDYSDERITAVFFPFLEFLVKVGISNEQYLKARTMAEMKKDSHEADILHAILARDNSAVLITRDAHFKCLGRLVRVNAPEEIVFC